MPHIVYHPDKPVGAFNVEEYCPFCDTDIPILFDMDDREVLKTTCPVCHQTLMICTMCPHRSECNYHDETGCRHNIRITDSTMRMIADFMNDDIRETVHAELAPCTPEAFLRRYLILDPKFLTVLNEFHIEL